MRSVRGICFVVLALVVVFFVQGPELVHNAKARSTGEDTTETGSLCVDIIRTFKSAQVLCEKYIVRKGDSIWKVLLDRFQGPISQIRYWSKALQSFNPEVSDLNRIYPGQELLVPVGFLAATQAQEQVKAAEPQTRIYEVKAGETVTGILRHRFHFPEHLVFNEALNQLKQLNPQLKDLNQIRPGQRLIIPSSGSVGSLPAVDPGAVREAAATGALSPEFEQPPAFAVEEFEGEQVSRRASGTGEVIIDAQRSPEARDGTEVEEGTSDHAHETGRSSGIMAEERRFQASTDAVMAVVVALGGRVQNSGLHFLPLDGQVQITLESNSVPVLEFPGGERILLDLSDRIPASLEEAIGANWGRRYRVVRPREISDFHSLWQRMIEQLAHMNLWTHGNPLLVHEPLEIAIRGDWVLIASGPEHRGRKVFVINVLKGDEERTDPALQTYLDGLGIRVIDVQMRGELERALVSAPLNERASAINHPVLVVRSSRSAQEGVAKFLDLLGQKYQRDVKVSLHPQHQEDVSVTVKAGFYFQRRGNVHMVDFGSLAPPMLRFLQEQGVKVLVVDHRWSSVELFRAMMEHLNLNAESSYDFFVSTREPMRNIWLSLAGYLIRENDQSYLITSVPVKTSLAEFLNRKGIRVLSY